MACSDWLGHGFEYNSRRPEMNKAIVTLLLASTLLLGACNAVKGLGRDIESVGNAGDRAT
jgi:predicted small secreted protein